MDTQNGVIEIAGMQITPEQVEQARLAMVNADEVVTETLVVKVRIYVEEPVVDDDGRPLLGDDGQPLKYRKAKTRTARIQNAVPIDIYAKAMTIAGDLQRMREGAMPDTSAIEAMRDMVLEVWQISEPWMSAKMLKEGVDGSKVIELFTHFFAKLTPR